jgi:predicted O-methyltransferase YrrM
MAPLRYFDKILPNQASLSDLYAGDAATFPAALFRSMLASCAVPATEQRFKLVHSDKFSIAEMGSSPVQLRILELLVALSGAKSVLEIGTFIGVSAMAFATAMPVDGRVVTIERFDHFAGLARQNFAANEVGRKIELIEGDAMEVMSGFSPDRRFDAVFIDGNKERYAEYFTVAAKHLNPGGMIAVDDVFFHGDALNDAPSTEKGRGVKAFLDLAATRNDFFKATIPVANGLMVLLHRP